MQVNTMKIPQTIQEEILKLQPALLQTPVEFGTVSGLLQAVKFAYKPNPIAAAAQVAIQARQRINTILLQTGVMVCIHPWVSGAGEFGNGKYTEQLHGYLSSQEAAEHLKKKFADPEDFMKDNVTAGFCIVASSDNLDAWVDKLSTLNEFYPFPGSMMCEKRAAALANINNSKMQRRAPAVNPIFGDYQVSSEFTAGDTKKISDTLLGTVEAFAMDTNPIAELSAVIAEETALIAETEKAWTNLVAGISGGSIDAYYTAGANPSSVGSALAANIAKDNSKYCCIVAIGGSVANLEFFREAFNL